MQKRGAQLSPSPVLRARSEQEALIKTYNAPKENTPTRLILFRMLIWSLMIILTGRRITQKSKRASMMPVANQKMLKLKQYGAGLRLLIQLHFMGQQSKMVAVCFSRSSASVASS